MTKVNKGVFTLNSNKRIGVKRKKMIYTQGKMNRLTNVQTNKDAGKKFELDR